MSLKIIPAMPVILSRSILSMDFRFGTPMIVLSVNDKVKIDMKGYTEFHHNGMGYPTVSSNIFHWN